MLLQPLSFILIVRNVINNGIYQVYTGIYRYIGVYNASETSYIMPKQNSSLLICIAIGFDTSYTQQLVLVATDNRITHISMFCTISLFL